MEHNMDINHNYICIDSFYLAKKNTIDSFGKIARTSGLELD